MSVLELDAKCRTKDIAEETQREVMKTRDAWAFMVMHPIINAALCNAYLKELLGGAKVVSVYRSMSGERNHNGFLDAKREYVIKSSKHIGDVSGHLTPPYREGRQRVFTSLNFEYNDPDTCATYHYQFYCGVNSDEALPRLEFGIINDYSQHHQHHKPWYYEIDIAPEGEKFTSEMIRVIRKVFTLYLEHADQMRGRGEKQTIEQIIDEHAPELTEES